MSFDEGNQNCECDVSGVRNECGLTCYSKPSRTYCLLGCREIVISQWSESYISKNPRLLLFICDICQRTKIKPFGEIWGRDVKFLVVNPSQQVPDGLRMLITQAKYTFQTIRVTYVRIPNGLRLDFYLRRSAIYSSLAEASPLPSIQASVLTHVLLELFEREMKNGDGNYALETNDYVKQKDGSHRLSGFFNSLRDARRKPNNWSISSESLVPKLRRYQEEAVCFMIDREVTPTVQMSLSKMEFIEIPSTPPFYYNAKTGICLEHKSNCFVGSPGGILADEMGLGKTVEIIALILTHTRNKAVSLGTSYFTPFDPVRHVVDDLISTTVVIIEGSSGFEATQKPARQMYYNTIPSKKVGTGRDNDDHLTVECVKCGDKCLRESVHWNDFNSSDVTFECPSCLGKKEVLLQVKTTLIIVPSTICQQWYEELKRHIKSSVYRGVSKDGFKHPQYLATKDIVLCPFQVLRNEVNFLNIRSWKGILRKRKCGLIPCSPLKLIDWWRICVDESHEISLLGSVFEVCSQLTAVNRWCMTGTPIKGFISSYQISGESENKLYSDVPWSDITSLSNVRSMVAFLLIEPFCYPKIFDAFFCVPSIDACSNGLTEFLSQIMWRNSKVDVIDQLDKLMKGSELTVVRFDPVEEQLYHEIAKRNVDGFVLDKSLDCFDCDDGTISTLLRISAVHPGFHYRNKANVGGKLSSAEAMHEQLFRLTANNVEECQRSLLFHTIGLAATAWLMKEYSVAAWYYRDAWNSVKLLERINDDLGLVDERGPYRKLKSDKIQMIHILSSVLELKIEANIEVLDESEENCRIMIERIETQYLEQAKVAVCEALVKCSSVKKDVTMLVELGESKILVPFASLMETAKCNRMDGSLLNRIISALEKQFPMQSWTSMVGSTAGVMFLISSRWRRIFASFLASLKLYKQIASFSKDDPLIQQLSNQHYVVGCKNSPSIQRCILCEFNEAIGQLEENLFVTTSEKSVKRTTNRTIPTEHSGGETGDFGVSGSLKESQFEVILRSLLSSASRKVKMQSQSVYEQSDIDDAKRCLQCLEKLKFYLRCMKLLWIALSTLISKIDELRMCREHVKFATEEELSSERQLPPGVIDESSVESERAAHSISLKTLSEQRRCLLSKFRYVYSLHNRNENEEVCPVCLVALGYAWVVFPCAHCTCPTCYRQLQTVCGKYRKSAQCPTCRQSCSCSEISYVQLPSRNENLHFLDFSDIKLKADYSSKLNAIVVRLKSIRRRDPWAKTLLFTSFAQLLPLLYQCLEDNDVNYRKFLAASNQQKNLSQFRNDPSVEVLVMLLSSGGRGLNLTCANHVIFVEPTADKAQISQAIGRIDRIGQKRNIMVHHFVMFGSIEERIYRFMSAEADS